jgi:hypothetical protein
MAGARQAQVSLYPAVRNSSHLLVKKRSGPAYASPRTGQDREAPIRATCRDAIRL